MLIIKFLLVAATLPKFSFLKNKSSTFPKKCMNYLGDQHGNTIYETYQ